MKRIILVETSDSTRERFQNDLCEQGFNVTSFGTPVDALVEISAIPPDLLISDVEMPGMNGLELAEAARDRAAGLPVILITSDPAARERAISNTLGISHVLMKPVDGFAELRAAIRRELLWDEALDTVHTLDELRLEFFTDLSHQLRTPLTSMKLAIDGLFGHLQDAKIPPQQDLAAISRRNVERIVSLVENQLDLLQVMMGESRVSRRLVDLNRLVADVRARLFANKSAAVAETISIETGSQRKDTPSVQPEPVYVFTDPGPLAAVIHNLLSSGPSNAKRELRLDFDSTGSRCCLDVGLNYLDCMCNDEQNEASIAGSGIGRRPSRLDFECRAYESLLNQLGGTIILEKSDNYKRSRISLPRCPEFDHKKDFLNPVQLLRTAAEAGGQNVSILKCRLGNGDSVDFFEDAYPEICDFFGRVESILSDGDIILRGKQPQTLYLALIERSPHELDRVKSFLDDHHRDLYVSKPKIIVPDQSVVVAPFDDLELV